MRFWRRVQRTAVSAGLAAMLLSPVGAQGPAPGGVAERATHREVPRQLQLITEPGRLLASNIRLGRIDEWPLEADETVLRTVVANAVVAAATEQRLIAYGPVIGWRELALQPGEQVQTLEAEDYALFVTTDRRYLNFSADTGIWATAVR